MIEKPIKSVEWISSSKRDYAAFPELVQNRMGFALYVAQVGEWHEKAKPLKGFGGANVAEIVEDHQSGTYHAVYTVRFAGAIYVLHAFQKKFRKGIKTGRGDIELVRKRLKMAEEKYRQKLAEDRYGKRH